MEEKKTRADGRKMRNGQNRPLCFAWNRAEDGCSQKCPKNMAHQCEFCLSQQHRAIACPKKPEGFTFT